MSNPVEYAEQSLGVHDVYERAKDFAGSAQAYHEEMANHADDVRRLRERVADQEAHLVTVERGVNAEMSGTAFAEHMKVIVRLNPDLMMLRENLLDAQRDHDWAESQERGFRGKADVEMARLYELGGLLLFYGVAKIGPVLERLSTPVQQVGKSITS